MRTGAIFARGSCRALAWVLALGAVVALSVGEAYAQTTVIVPDSVVVTPGSLTIDEGDAKTFTVQLKTKAVTIPAGVSGGPTNPGAVTVTVTQVLAGANDGANFELDNQPLSGAANAVIADVAYAFDISGETTAGTVDTTTPGSGESTVSARTDGNAVDGRNVLFFDSDFAHAAYDHDNDPGTPDGGALDVTAKRVPINEVDSEDAGVDVSERALTVLEGSTGTYTIELGSEPTHDVTVEVNVTDQVNANITVMPDELVFLGAGSATSGAQAWNRPYTVTVTAGTDSNTSNGSATITHALTSDDTNYIIAASKAPKVEITEIDSVRTVTLSTSADTVDEGKTITITATLESPAVDTPGSLAEPVEITLTKKGKTPPAGDYSVAPAKITIGKDSTAGSTKLTARHDADAVNETLTLIASISKGPGIYEFTDNEISVTFMDNDSYMLEADKEEVAEGGEVTLTVTVDPAAEVAETKVSIDLYRASGSTVAPAEGQDKDDDGNAIIDEGEKTAKFTLKTAKDANDRNDEVIVVRAMVGSSVVGEPVTINVLDTQASPEFTFSLDPTFIGEADGEQSVTLMAMTNKAVTADTMVKFAVEADSTAMNPDDYTIMPESGMIELTVEKGMTSGMTEFMVTPVMDSMDESNESIKLSGWVDADDDPDFEKMVGNYVDLTIIDGDSPGSGITPKSSDDVAMVFSDAIETAGGLMVGGNMVTVDMNMLFNMANPNMEVMYTASSSDESVLEVSASESMLMLDPMMMGMSTVSVMAEPADGGTGASAVAAFSCSGACVSVNLDVMGAITFMLTGPEDMNLAEGGESAMVMVTASSALVADTEVSLMRDGTSTASMDDYSVEPMMVTIMAGETMAEFEVMATDDEMMEEAEMLTLFLVVDDMQMTDQSVSFYLWDAAVPALPAIAQLLLAALMAIGGYRRYLRR